MAAYDLQKTHEVDQLLQVPDAKRDAAWRARFFAVIPEASMASTPEQVMQGPDGFPYFVLKRPTPGVAFTAFCLSEVLDHCTTRGLGAVIDPQPGGAGWVFSYGDLWSLRSYGTFEGDPVDEEREGAAGATVLAEDRKVMLGAPSEDYLPSWARRVLHGFLTQSARVKEPTVMLLIDPSMRPSRNLIFGVHPEDFPSPEQFQGLLGALHWFLPPRRGLVGVSRSAGFLDALQPLLP
jgi:hypothetical protein